MDKKQRQKKIIVFGFPHSGTTILKELINRCNNAEAFEKETIFFESFKTSSDFKCIKTPFFFEGIHSNYYSDSIKIFILRNPLFSFSSIHRRTGVFQPKLHTLEDWKNTANNWIIKTVKDCHYVLYEDLFYNNNKEVKRIFKSIGLEFDDGIFSGNEIDTSIIEINHSEFRKMQINSKFKNMNTAEKITIPNTLIKEITSTEQFKLIYG